MIKSPYNSEVEKIQLSNMTFNKVGNEKNYQHYKNVLSLILFDIMSRSSNIELKKLVENLMKNFSVYDN